MPNRVLQSSSLTSESLSHLSAESERLFHRLVLVADDWGRFEARNSVVRSGCFPVHDVGISLGEIDHWLAGLLDQNIIYTYSSNGRLYGHFVNWWKYQRWRGNKSKHPEPPNGDLRENPHAASSSETKELAAVSQDFAANNQQLAADMPVSPLAHGRHDRAATGVVVVVEDVVEDGDGDVPGKLRDIYIASNNGRDPEETDGSLGRDSSPDYGQSRLQAEVDASADLREQRRRDRRVPDV